MNAAATNVRDHAANAAPVTLGTAATSLEVFWTDFNPDNPGYAFIARCHDQLLMAGPLTADDLDEAIENAKATTGFTCDDQTLELRDDDRQRLVFTR